MGTSGRPNLAMKDSIWSRGSLAETCPEEPTKQQKETRETGGYGFRRVRDKRRRFPSSPIFCAKGDESWRDRSRALSEERKWRQQAEQG